MIPPPINVPFVPQLADMVSKTFSTEHHVKEARGHIATSDATYDKNKEFLTDLDRHEHWVKTKELELRIGNVVNAAPGLTKLKNSLAVKRKAKKYSEAFLTSSEILRREEMERRTGRELELGQSSTGSQQLSSHVPSGSKRSTTSSPLVNVAASKAAGKANFDQYPDRGNTHGSVDKGKGKQRDTSSHVPPGPRQSTTSSPLVNVAASKAAGKANFDQYPDRGNTHGSVDKGKGKQRDTSSHVPPGPRQSTTSSPLVNVAASKAFGGVNVSQYPDRANTHVSVDKGKGKQRDTSSQVPPGPRQSTTSSQVHVAGSKAAAGPSSSDHSGWTSGTQLPVYTLCSLCPLAFPTVKNFITHMRAAHSKYNICDYCGDHRNTREELQGHIRRNHSSP
ncbi:hypothetical protein JB92DRAFT_3097893 [Gautieria morchelliformis]|nr:hypothetical protein JB92DRAFT_3097893 [Gautieria morchelliformis]